MTKSLVDRNIDWPRDIELLEIATKCGASQDPFELFKLMEVVDQIRPERILEIGVHRGLSIKAWRQAWPDAEIVGIDTDFSHLEFEDFMCVECDSHDPKTAELIAELSPGRFDFVFVDGDHSLEGVRKDYEIYKNFVEDGGIMAFHDIMRSPERISYHAGVECRTFFDEVKVEHANMEIWNGEASDNGPGIGVLFL